MHFKQHHFSVYFLKPHLDFWVMQFKVQSDFCSTAQLPTLTSDMRILLPEILVAACDNPKKLPFIKEMRNTQTAHLFEHILLEYLCKLRLLEGAREASYEGRTFWDISRQTGEESTIVVSRQGETTSQFFQAVRLSSQLLSKLICDTNATYTTTHAERGVEPLSMFAM